VVDRFAGGDNAALVIDGTALAKKGRHSVGVAPQYASTLSKNANCQTLVSMTLTRGELPVMTRHTRSLGLMRPADWAQSTSRLQAP
jgi:SRSO17 transposase